jgi:hypothetical protein
VRPVNQEQRRKTVKRLIVGLIAVVVAAVCGGIAEGGRHSADSGTRVTATLSLRAAIPTESSSASRRFGEDCAPGTPETVECFDVRGSGTVRGLGRVVLRSLHFVDTAPQGCPSGQFRVLDASVRLVVAGKGSIELRLDPAAGCKTLATVLSHTRSYTITRGTGTYAGATGTGTVRRQASFGGSGAVGKDFVVGSVAVPGVQFDLAPPRLSGAAPKTVRAAQGATRARVVYRVGARDAVDGIVPVKCTPPSGRQFRVGRTVVTCSATDSSGNAARARFTVTVRRTA